MPPPGGLSDKIGNRYERRIALWRLLQLIDEQHDSVRVRFEKPGDDDFEWWVQHADGSRTYTQVKRQQAPDQGWSIRTLVSRGVLTAFGDRLRDEPAARCEFFSALSASHLQELTESAPMAADLNEFEIQYAAAKDKRASWDEIRRAWPGITRDQAWRRLQRISVGTIDERSLRDLLLALARASAAGSPDDVIARLGDFLEGHFAQELTAEDVWEFLRGAGHPPVDWARDRSVHARVHDITRAYRAGITADRGPLAEIRRSATGNIARLVAGPADPDVVTVAADAGMGKTALLGQILDALDTLLPDGGPIAERPVVLAARLDRLGEFGDAAGLGTALRLPGSPAAVLSRVAAGRPALLVLDQVDAFGAGSGRNPARLDAVAEVLREARALSVRVVLACRAFDLEVDPRLAELAGVTGPGGHADGHRVERLGPLPASDVDKALHDVGIIPASLTPSLHELLETPLHLRMLVTLQQHGRIDPAGITTRVQLFTGFYRAVCDEVENRQATASVTEITDTLAAALSERQELSAPAALLSQNVLTVDHLVSAGWFRRDAGRVAFAHEAFFDFAYAQRHLRSQLSLLGLLRSGEQHLFRRGQVRQILTLERDQDRGQYLRDVRDVLSADDVRPHIKELVIALVTWIPDPVIEEWQALGVLGDAADNPLADRAHTLAARAPAFSTLLLTEGVVASHLSDPATADLGAGMCQIMVQTYPNDVAELLHPYVGQAGWAGRLARVLKVAPLRDSEKVADLMEAAIAAGDLDDAIRDQAGSRDPFSLLYGLTGETAARGAMLVAAILRRRLTLLVTDGAYRPVTESVDDHAKSTPDASGTHRSEDRETAIVRALTAFHNTQARRLVTESMSAPEILATVAADDPAGFVRHLLPVAREAAQASRTGEVTERGEHDQAFGMPPSLRPEHDPSEILLGRLAQAVRISAEAGDHSVHAVVRQMAGSPLATEQALAAAGFAAGHPRLLDDATAWLETGRYALAQGWYEDLHGLSADVIAQVCTQLPADRTQAVQERAAFYTTDFEKVRRHRYGSAAHRLLRDVPPGQLTAMARARRDELNRKFPPEPAPRLPSGAVRDISVDSPISLDAISRMTDDQLIGAMRRWSSDQYQPMEDGRLRGGATSVAQVIGAAAQADPGRFIVVLEALPADIQFVYIQQILSGLSRSTATPVQVLRAVKATRGCVATCSREIAWLIGQAAEHLDAAVLTEAELTMTGLLAVLEEILTLRPAAIRSTKRPAALLREWSRYVSRWWRSRRTPAADAAEEGKKLAERLTNGILNQPEYPALRALALLARDKPEAAALLTAQVERLAISPHLPLRALAIEVAATRPDHDPYAVMHIVATALDTGELAPDTGNEPLPAHTCVLLASDQLRNLLLRLCWPHYDLAVPILARMLRNRAALRIPPTDMAASAAQTAQNAAMVAATAAGRHPEAAKLTQKLARQDAHRRRGIALALAHILPLTQLTGEQTTLLARLFDDPDNEVARLAATSLRTIPADANDLAQTLMTAAAKARTFTLDPAQIIFAIEHYRGNIPGIVLDVADRFFQLHASQAANLSGHGFHDAMVLGRLVISIYDSSYRPETPTSPLASRALDLIDAMILARTYELEERLAQLDR